MVKGGLWFNEMVGVNWRWDEGIHKSLRFGGHPLCVGRKSVERSHKQRGDS
jgi:hypothetical protein